MWPWEWWGVDSKPKCVIPVPLSQYRNYSMKIATTMKAASAAAAVRSLWQMSLLLARTMSSCVTSVTAAPSPPSAQPVGRLSCLVWAWGLTGPLDGKDGQGVAMLGVQGEWSP